jgi:hypothetical protein
MPVLLDVDIPTMDTADLIVREAVLDEELLQGLRINDFGKFCRKPKQAKNGRLVLCGQRIEHLHYYADFWHKASFYINIAKTERFVMSDCVKNEVYPSKLAKMSEFRHIFSRATLWVDIANEIYR